LRDYFRAKSGPFSGLFNGYSGDEILSISQIFHGGSERDPDRACLFSGNINGGTLNPDLPEFTVFTLYSMGKPEYIEFQFTGMYT
jgi:hypothetical protein